jgi:WYL_2, Sm-like SH3 beta-barrel fold
MSKAGMERIPASPDVIRYFDLDADAWRSFRVDRFISQQAA